MPIKNIKLLDCLLSQSNQTHSTGRKYDKEFVNLADIMENNKLNDGRDICNEMPPSFKSYVFLPKFNNELEKYKVFCLQKYKMEYELTMFYYQRTGHWLDFRHLDEFLGIPSFSPDERTAQQVAAAFSEVAKIVLQKDDQSLFETTEKPGKSLMSGLRPKAKDLELCKMFYTLLTGRNHLDSRLIKTAITTANFQFFKNRFQGIYPLMMWISIIGRMDFLQRHHKWIDWAAASIGRTKNKCDSAFRKCKNIEVLQLCREYEFELYPCQYDLLSKPTNK